jgi:hypothetical protein
MVLLDGAMSGHVEATKALLGPVTAKNLPIAFASGAAIFSRFANWLLASSWVEREGMG